MPENAKPAEGIGGHREIIIADWKPHSKNTLRGFLSVKLPSGITIHNITVHEKGEARWIGLPARSYQTDSGETAWSPIIEIADRSTANRFRDEVLDAFDRYLAEAIE